MGSIFFVFSDFLSFHIRSGVRRKDPFLRNFKIGPITSKFFLISLPDTWDRWTRAKKVKKKWVRFFCLSFHIRSGVRRKDPFLRNFKISPITSKFFLISLPDTWHRWTRAKKVKKKWVRFFCLSFHLRSGVRRKDLFLRNFKNGPITSKFFLISLPDTWDRWTRAKKVKKKCVRFFLSFQIFSVFT
jgi:hypothetical protein